MTAATTMNRADIVVGSRLRPLNEERIADLARSFEAVGMMHPITVRRAFADDMCVAVRTDRPSPTMAAPLICPAVIPCVTRPFETLHNLANSDFRTTAKWKIPSLGAQACLGLFRTLLVEKRRKTASLGVKLFRGPAASLGRKTVCDWLLPAAPRPTSGVGVGEGPAALRTRIPRPYSAVRPAPVCLAWQGRPSFQHTARKVLKARSQ